MGDRGPQSSGASAGEGFQGWVSCHYSYGIGKAMVIFKKSCFPPHYPCHCKVQQSSTHQPPSAVSNLWCPLVRKRNATWTTLKLENQEMQLSLSCCFLLGQLPILIILVKRSITMRAAVGISWQRKFCQIRPVDYECSSPSWGVIWCSYEQKDFALDTRNLIPI